MSDTINLPEPLKPINATPLAPVITQQLKRKTVLMKDLLKEIPKTDLHLPEYYYRVDILPENLEDFPSEERMDYLEQSIVELDYAQGYPTQPNTDPFWGQLPHEPAKAYRAFLAYMDLPRSQAQRLPAQTAEPHPLSNHTMQAVPVRQLHLLKTIVPEASEDLLDFYYQYFWAARIRAYDLFHAAHHNKMKEHRLMNAEDQHYATATQFLAYAENFLHQVFTNPDEYELKPKEAMDLMIKMIQVQRISTGATAWGAQGKDASSLPRNASMEVILRQIAQQAGADTIKEDKVDPTKALLQDPEALMQAQELIVRMHNMSDNSMRKGSNDFDDLDHNTNTQKVT